MRGACNSIVTIELEASTLPSVSTCLQRPLPCRLDWKLCTLQEGCDDTCTFAISNGAFVSLELSQPHARSSKVWSSTARAKSQMLPERASYAMASLHSARAPLQPRFAYQREPDHDTSTHTIVVHETRAILDACSGDACVLDYNSNHRFVALPATADKCYQLAKL